MSKHRRSVLGALFALLLLALIASPASAAPPTNDAFGDAELISGTLGFTSGTNAEASKEVGEPDHAGKPGGASIWYRWTAPRSGRATFSTCASDFNTLLAVYTGASLSALTPVASNDDACGAQSIATFSAVAGTTYSIAVDGDAAATGTVGLDWALAPANDDFAARELLSGDTGTLTGTTLAATKETGEPDHAGNPGGSSVWYRWVAPSNGPMAIDTCGSDFDTLIAVYTGTSVGALSVVTSNDDSCGLQSRVGFQAVAGTEYEIAVDGFDGEEGDVAGGWSRTAIAPAPLEVPTIAGDARDGSLLSASTGRWSGTPPFTYTFRWVRCAAFGVTCNDVAGATAQTYALHGADVGYRMRVLVTASNSAGSAFAASDATTVITGLAPSNATAPSVKGVPRIGETLSAEPGVWQGTTPLAYAYQWLRCDPAGEACVELPGEALPDLDLDASLRGATIRVVVSATNVAGSASAVSSQVGPVRALPQCVVPRVTGKKLAAARRAIARAHCAVGTVRRASSARVKAGHVISQRPRPGTRRANGTRVSLVVSKGPRRNR